MMGEDRILLEAEIRKKLRDFQLEVSFAAGRGCLGLLGPSGCGKSMTLKSIAGILAPDEGRIALNGGRCCLIPGRGFPFRLKSVGQDIYFRIMPFFQI